MNDERIIDLFFERSEQAIKELDGKNYGQMLISLPSDATEAFHKTCDWLNKNNVKFSVEGTQTKSKEEEQ